MLITFEAVFLKNHSFFQIIWSHALVKFFL